MSLQERVMQLRKEDGWSQGEPAERVGGDPAQISRDENGRITPSADAAVKPGEVFDVSTDYLDALVTRTGSSRSPAGSASADQAVEKPEPAWSEVEANARMAYRLSPSPSRLQRPGRPTDRECNPHNGEQQAGRAEK